jgi:hypothetical protein
MTPKPLSPRGRGVGERGLLESRQNQLRHPFFICEKVVVPESHNAKTLCPQESISALIGCTRGMLSPVEFDDQAPLKADEIRNVEFDRNLTPEFVPGEAMRTEKLP